MWTARILNKTGLTYEQALDEEFKGLQKQGLGDVPKATLGAVIANVGYRDESLEELVS